MAETAKTKKSWRSAKGGGKKTCGEKDCKRPYRAKGYCHFHYDKWRAGSLPHTRYKTCSKPECRKRVFKGGLCETHHNELRGTTAAAAPAAAPAAAAPAPA